MQGSVTELRARLKSTLHRITHAMQALQVPSIAAVNGAAVGAGCDLALMCDLRVASERATFAESFLRLGLVSGIGGAWFLTRIVGRAKALELTLTSEFIDAQTAYNIGIVQGVYPQDKLMEEATKLAETINANGKVVVQLTKEYIYNSLDMPLHKAREMERVYYQRIRQSPDYDEGSAAFTQRRKPEFSGKPSGATPKL